MQRPYEWASTQKAVFIAVPWADMEGCGSLEQCSLWGGESLRLLEELIFHFCEIIVSSSLYLYVKAFELSYVMKEQWLFI